MSDPVVVEIGLFEGPADLQRRRPDLFRAMPGGNVEVIAAALGGRPLHIVRASNPQPQIPLRADGALKEASRIVARCVGRCIGGSRQ